MGGQFGWLSTHHLGIWWQESYSWNQRLLVSDWQPSSRKWTWYATSTHLSFLLCYLRRKTQRVLSVGCQQTCFPWRVLKYMDKSQFELSWGTCIVSQPPALELSEGHPMEGWTSPGPTANTHVKSHVSRHHHWAAVSISVALELSSWMSVWWPKMARWNTDWDTWFFSPWHIHIYIHTNTHMHQTCINSYTILYICRNTYVYMLIETYIYTYVSNMYMPTHNHRHTDTPRRLLHSITYGSTGQFCVTQTAWCSKKTEIRNIRNIRFFFLVQGRFRKGSYTSIREKTTLFSFTSKLFGGLSPLGLGCFLTF